MTHIKKNHFLFLDALRGVAAIAVMLYHCFYMIGIGSFLSHGYLAVDFFFMLSGFVIAHAYEKDLLNGDVSFIRFVRARLIRLYPMVALGMTIGAAISLYVWHQDCLNHDPHYDPLHLRLTYYLFGLLLLPPLTFGAFLVSPLNGPLWSIIFEMFINLIYAPIVRFLNNKLLTSIIVISSIMLCASIWHFGTVSSLGVVQSQFIFGFIRVIAPFCIGIALLRLARARITERIKLPSWVILALLVASFIPPKFPGSSIYQMACILLAFPLIIAAGSNCIVGGKFQNVCKILGRVSYPLYAIHFPLIGHLGHLKGASAFTKIGETGLTSVVLIILSYLVLRIYDEPVRRWLANLSFRSSSAISNCDTIRS